jgi:HD superfamily phosphohydrolase YqeK|uniref:HDc n=1 Tax=Myoviridae sp. ctshb19 TaxID=2825194 RepID=A0A8S5UG70_9CAUD|nr:MAG TPA: HDc [Myoviridae sp. ctshb19]
MKYDNKNAYVLDAELDVATAYRRALFEAAIDEYIQQPQFDTHQPYHNADHCIRVAHRCLELFAAMGWRLRHEISMTMCAALFHDFGHTGKGPDIKNIERAVAGLRAAEPVLLYFGGVSVGHMENMIRCTEFRHGFPNPPLNLMEKVLRDADVMESCEPRSVKTVMFDLCAELDVDVRAAVPKQVEFLQNVHMYTDPGRLIWNRTLDARIAACEALLHE